MRLIVTEILLLTIAVASASVLVTKTSNDAPHPSTMELEVTLPDSNNKVRIPLERTDAFENIPMTLIENGVSRTFSSHQVHHASHAHYRDIQSKSVISVRHVDGQRQISGHVTHEGTSYFLEPIGAFEHRVLKNSASPEVMVKRVNSNRRRQYNKRQSDATRTENVVELYLLLDSTVFAAFNKIFGTEAAALIELHYYYTHILNGIDISFRNMGTPSISVSCIGITISKTTADDKWMPAGLDGGEILTKMTEYITGKPADHYMAFTRKDITGDGNPSVCGMAYVSGTCTNGQKVSINEDQGLQSWGTAAHELGHNLGSEHDGSDASCSAELLNLMSPSSGTYTLDKIANSYQFSSCSKDFIKKYIESLGPSSCLLSAQGNRVPQLTATESEGRRMSLDRVCQLSYPDGPGKVFVDENIQEKPAGICASIYCLTKEGGGTSSGGLRAPVGTSCGDKKSCDWKGQCSADSSAPAADESCFWGDTLPDCANEKENIVNGRNTCSGDVKKGCCKSLKGLKECAGV